jgi:hypothetical protein
VSGAIREMIETRFKELLIKEDAARHAKTRRQREAALEYVIEVAHKDRNCPFSRHAARFLLAHFKVEVCFSSAA